MDIQTKDGILLRNIPDGTPEEEIKARINKIRSERTAAPEPMGPPERKLAPEQNMSMLEKALANIPSWALPPPLRPENELPLRRVMQGAADPSLGLMQLAARPFGMGKEADEFIKKQEAEYQGRRGSYAKKLDLLRIGGNVAAPANVLLFKGVPAVSGGLGARSAAAAGMGAAGGLMNPETGDDFASEKAKSVVAGALLGPAAEIAGAGAKKVADVTLRPIAMAIDSVLPGGADRAAKRILREAAGDKADDVSRAITQSLQDQKSSPLSGYKMTTAEAAEPAGSYGVAGLEKMLRGNKVVVDKTGAIERGNRAALVDAIESFGKTAKDVDAAKEARGEAYRAATERVMGNKVPLKSDAAIISEAIAGRQSSKNLALQEAGKFATEEAENITRGANFTPVPGMPRVSGRVSPFPERTAEAASAKLDAAQIYKDRSFAEDFLRRFEGMYKPSDAGLASMLDRPSIQQAFSKALNIAKERGTSFSGADDISVGNAQSMKMVLDDLIADPKTYGIGASEVNAIRDTRGKFIEWLASKSPEWDAARRNYAKASVPINEMEVGQQLAKSLKNVTSEELPVRASTFQAAKENAPKTIKTATGRQVANTLEEVLSPENMAKVDAVSESLARQGRTAEMQNRGLEAASELLRRGNPQLPNALDTKITIANALLRRASGFGGEKAEQRLAEMLITQPDKVAELLKSVPPGQANQLLELLMSNRTYGYQLAPQVSSGEQK